MTADFIDNYYRNIYPVAQKEIRSQPDSYLLTVDLDEYADYLVRKYGFSEIEPDSNRQITSEKIRSTAKRDRFGDRRDSYGVVIVFSKRKGFSKVLETTASHILQLPSYIKAFKKIDESHFSGSFALPEDEHKLVELHFMILQPMRFIDFTRGCKEDLLTGWLS